MKRKVVVSVIGGSKVDIKVSYLAHNVGNIIAKVGCILVCGGLFGAMEAASKGAKEAKGMTIGLIPGKNKAEANSYLDIVIVTTIGYARNAMVAATGDIIVALPGSHGTLSEICYGLVYGKPIIDMGNWRRPGMIKVKGLKGFEKKLREMVKEI